MPPRQLTSRHEGPLPDFAEVLRVEGLMPHFTIHVTSDSGLHKMNVCEPKLVQLLRQIDVRVIWVIIVHITKLAIGGQPAPFKESHMTEKHCTTLCMPPADLKPKA